MEKLEKRIHDDSNGLDYVLVGDCLLYTSSCVSAAVSSKTEDSFSAESSGTSLLKGRISIL